MENIKHYFAGINSKDGFVNRFNFINADEKATSYILKGGPGCGKSTLMKTVGDYFATKGEKVDFFHCSSDPESLDGIYLHTHKVSILDGTAPHICEPTIPVAKEFIINLGEFIDKKMQKYTQKLQKLNNLKKNQFEIAYHFLNSASQIYDANENLSSALPYKSLENFAVKVKIKPSEKFIYQEFFFECVYDNKIISFLKINKYFKTFSLEASQAENHRALENILKSCINKQTSVIKLCEILNPKKIKALYLPDNNIFIISSPQINSREILSNNKLIDNLCTKAGKHIKNAHNIHKKIEKTYKKHINYEEITQLTENLIFEIEYKKAR